MSCDVCVCVLVRTYVYMYVCMHVSLFVLPDDVWSVCHVMYVYVCMYVHSAVWNLSRNGCMYVHTYMYTRVCICIKHDGNVPSAEKSKGHCMYMFVCIHIHTYIHKIIERYLWRRNPRAAVRMQ
jgi:hypothetical protein